MSTVLGKRKKPSLATETEVAAEDIFRRHFEAQFKPLNGGAHKRTETQPALIDGSDDDEDETGSGSDWSGFSDDEEDEGNGGTVASPVVQIVDYSASSLANTPDTGMTKQERKLYLSSKPPSSFDDDEEGSSRGKNKNKSKNGGDGGGEGGADEKQYKDAPELLANDLALQRLISESHLLSGAFSLPSSFSTSSAAASAVVSGTASTSLKSNRPFAAGRLRQRTTDLRIQAVANKAKGDGAGSSSARASLITVSNASDSIFTQASMPMAQRKGIAAAAAARETKRRREARESGIVLERPMAAKPRKVSRRLRAVDAPAVGHLRGSELRLRERDVRAIEGLRKSIGMKKKRRR